MSCCYKYSFNNPYLVSISSNNNLRCFATYQPVISKDYNSYQEYINSLYKTYTHPTNPPIRTSSDFITFQRYTSSLCNKGGHCPRCFGDYPNQSNSSSYTTALKANLIYPAKFSTCNCINLGRGKV